MAELSLAALVPKLLHLSLQAGHAALQLPHLPLLLAQLGLQLAGLGGVTPSVTDAGKYIMLIAATELMLVLCHFYICVYVSECG